MKRRAYLPLAIVGVLLAVSIIHSVGRIAASVDPNSLLARGHAYYDANDLERAVSSYKEAIRLDPTCAQAYD
jgi:tetratricopeptide (TPR) repeat protein